MSQATEDDLLLAGLRDGAWLSSQTFAGTLVAEGRCSPQCLLALGDHNDGCKCRCEGAYHGALADTPIAAPAPARAWHDGHHGYGDLYLAPIFSVRSGDISSFNRFWRKCKASDGPAVWIVKTARTWSARYDTWTSPEWHIEDESAAAIEALVIGLIRQGHAEFGSFGEAGGVYRLRTEREARVIAAAFSEALYDNRAGIGRLVRALTG